MMNQIKHLAIIMDGNGRWAKLRNHNRFFGHVRGAKVAKSVIEYCAQSHLEFLTLFAFSSENWERPKKEVHFLMNLLSRYLLKEKKTLMANNIVFKTAGNISRLPEKIQYIIEDLTESTRHNTGMTLIFALSYGGKQDILYGIRKMLSDDPGIDLESLDEAKFSLYLENAATPDPDLILRTSGEHRISNFYLWQAAYSELEFSNTLWPDFTTEELSLVLNRFKHRERRFGKVT